MTAPVLEGAAQEIADATSKPPFLYELGAEGARKVLDGIKALPSTSRMWTIPGSRCRKRSATFESASSNRSAPATHDRLVRELATGVDAALAFVEYDRSPEAHYPVAIEQAYATARRLTADGAAQGLNVSRMAYARHLTQADVATQVVRGVDVLDTERGGGAVRASSARVRSRTRASALGVPGSAE